ncbi:MAG: ATP-binding cassette domain-containing protein [Paracoccaceae bacterium]
MAQESEKLNHEEEIILDVENYSVGLKKIKKSIVEAVSFSVIKGEIFGVAGESGSGKTLLTLSMFGLHNASHLNTGDVSFDLNKIIQSGVRVVQTKKLALRIGFILQDPFSSLNPSVKIGKQIGEAIYLAKGKKPKSIENRSLVYKLLSEVGIPDPENSYEQYPDQFSGGMRQRIVIAIALSQDPDLLIADEPTTALDASTQRKIIDLIIDRSRQRGLTVILVSHNIALLQATADRIAVMKSGKVLDIFNPKTIKLNELNSYTKVLFEGLKNVKKHSRTEQKQQNVSSLPLIEMKNIQKSFASRILQRGGNFSLSNINLEIFPGEVVGFLGESGSGKSTLASIITTLSIPNSGSYSYKGQNVFSFKKSEIKQFKSDVQMVFQDPYGSLNPRYNIRNAINEALLIHKPDLSKPSREERIIQLLTDVGLDGSAMEKFPHEFSGGQRQRIAIARAMSVDPEMLVCDEPLSSLDVSTQAQILDLFSNLLRRKKIAMIFITHDIKVAQILCDRVYILSNGQIVEQGKTQQVLTSPRHNYTSKLIEAVY